MSGTDIRRHMSERLDRGALNGAVRRTSSLSIRRGLNNPSLTISGPDQTPSLTGLTISNAPDRPTEILPFLFLGHEKHAASLNLLDDCKIDAILNVAAESERTRFEEKFAYQHKVIKDNFEEDIMKHFEDCFDFIEKSKSSGKTVLVHCTAGRSRSPTIAMAYLIYSKRWTLKQSYDYVKTKREISPNLGFLCMLAEFEKKVLGERNRGLTELCKSSLTDLTILIVEPDGESLDYNVDLMEQFEYKYDTVDNGDEAIRLMIDHPFDIVLLDLASPTVNALLTVKRIRELEHRGVMENRSTIFLLRTTENPAAYEQSGADGVLDKPLQRETLHEVLTQRLNRIAN